MMDFKRNNSIKLRNFSSQIDFHDIVKTMLVRMLRREHKDIKACQIYTEFNAEEPNENYPDIQMILKSKRKKTTEIYVFEIQREISKKWTKQIIEKHEAVTLIIIPLKEINEKWERRMLNNFTVNNKFNPIEELREVLTDYIF